MSIKSDHWIQNMAAEQQMIEPYESRQIKTVDGNRIVSYGTSSYGYDVRCSNEFKVFTNLESVIVDPKNFDESSFINKTADVCIIPPNSFALARTVEYFRIPRNVLTVCLG
ncbi:MAG: dCTP deaminase, partial [Woeseiaceae bacterium]|nr:dCTP deaminase [Woeseiaceae bacterium]